MIEVLLILGLATLLAWPLGLYLARVMRGAPMAVDMLFAPVERLLYALLGVDAHGGMSWRGYAIAFVASNACVGACVWLVFMTQAWLPLNPDAIANLRWDTALHTMVSFLTNTNQQHYSGQAQLSYLSQMAAITGLQVVTPMMGLALAVATLRAFFGGRVVAPSDAAATAPATAAAGPDMAGRHVPEVETSPPGRQPLDATPPPSDARDVDVGNYYVDVVRGCVRFMLPLCLA